MPVGLPSVERMNGRNQVCSGSLPAKTDRQHECGRSECGEPARGPRRSFPREQHGEKHEERKRKIERDLDREGPSGPDSSSDRSRLIMLNEEHVPEQAARVEKAAVFQASRRSSVKHALKQERTRQQNHPVRREDAQRSVAEILPDTRHRLSPHDGGGEGTEEQEAGESEKEGYAEREIRQETS